MKYYKGSDGKLAASQEQDDSIAMQAADSSQNGSIPSGSDSSKRGKKTVDATKPAKSYTPRTKKTGRP
jgi:hypothetical protein